MTEDNPSNDDTTPDLEPTTAAVAVPEVPAPTPPAVETEASIAPAHPRRTREIIAAGAVGLLVVGGLGGFGIGRATAGHDDQRFPRAGQVGPGQRGFGGPGRQRGQFGGGQGNGQGYGQGGQPGDQPPAQGDGSGGSNNNSGSSDGT